MIINLAFRLLLWSGGVLLASLLILGGYYVQQTAAERANLSESTLETRTNQCLAKEEQSRVAVQKIRQKGFRTTDPRVFYSPSLGRCLYTYLVINPKLPEATTFNEFLIYDLEKNQRLFLGEGIMLKTWTQYLEKISELESN